MLRQVWANLLSNAVKFSSASEHPRIEVTATEQGQEVVFCVSDNGVGFDESQAHRLFGVFERLHKASQFPGTGVGLSIVRRVVQRHGGRVWATSPAGGGARFHVALPQQAPQANHDAHNT
jgi:signal transduction histidine kinase